MFTFPDIDILHYIWLHSTSQPREIRLIYRYFIQMTISLFRFFVLACGDFFIFFHSVSPQFIGSTAKHKKEIIAEKRNAKFFFEHGASEQSSMWWRKEPLFFTRTVIVFLVPSWLRRKLCNKLYEILIIPSFVIYLLHNLNFLSDGKFSFLKRALVRCPREFKERRRKLRVPSRREKKGGKGKEN